MILLRFCDRAIGTVSLAILTRLIAPSDFGLVAMAAALLAIVEAFGQVGVDLALIRQQSHDRATYDSAWSLNIAIAAFLAVALAVLAVPLAGFFAEPRIVPILYWLAGGVAIGGLENVGIVTFRKDLAFNREFRFLFYARLLSTLVAVSAAAYWGDYRALVAGAVALRLARVGLSYAMHPFRPRIRLVEIRSLMRFSVWVAAQTVIGTINRRIPAILIGRWLGSSSVAFFTVAHEVATLATTEIIAPVRRVLYPAYAQIMADRARFVPAIIDSLGAMALIGLPAAAGVALVAPDVVRVLFGARWLETVPLVEILAIAGGIQCLGTSSQMVYLVLGKPRLTALIELIRLAIYVPALLLGVDWGGAIGAAWGYAAASVVVRLIDYAVVMRVVGLRAAAIAGALIRPLAATAIVVAIVRLTQGSLPTDTGIVWSLARIAISVAIGIAAYVGAVVTLWIAMGRPAAAEERLVSLFREWRIASS